MYTISRGRVKRYTWEGCGGPDSTCTLRNTLPASVSLYAWLEGMAGSGFRAHQAVHVLGEVEILIEAQRGEGQVRAVL